MPQLGDKIKGTEIGHPRNDQYIWHGCQDCGKERWVRLTHRQPSNLKCHVCAAKNNLHPYGSENSNWKGGRRKTGKGYIEVKLIPDDFFYSMSDKWGYVAEHRLVVAKSLRRCLHLWEIVHHKNGTKDDNRLENLQLISELGHRQLTLMENRIRVLEQRVTMLEAENVLLKAESNEPFTIIARRR